MYIPFTANLPFSFHTFLQLGNGGVDLQGRPQPALAKMSSSNVWGGDALEVGQEWALQIEDLPSASGVEVMAAIPRLR